MNAWHAENYRVILEALREVWNSKTQQKARDVQLNIIGSLTGKAAKMAHLHKLAAQLPEPLERLF